MGHAISANTVGKLLTTELGFSRQHNRKADEGSKHPDRDAQLAHINTKVAAAQAKRQLSSLSTRRRRNWWATTGTVAATIGRRAIRAASTCTTSRTRSWARWCPT